MADLDPDSSPVLPPADAENGPQPDTARTRARTLAVSLVVAILVLLAGWALKAMASVVIPVVLAVFTTLVVLPLDRALADRLPGTLSWLGRAAVMALLLLVLVVFMGGLAYSVTQIAAALPDMSVGIDGVLPEADGEGPWAMLRSGISGIVEGQATLLTSRLVDTMTSLAQSMASATGVVFAGMFLVLFLILLALSEAATWEAKLDSLSAGTHGSWRDVTATLGATLRRFIVTRAAVGVISALAYTLWLWPFGLDLLVVWAVLTFLMVFIPNLGAVVSGIFPTLYAVFTMDFATAMVIGAGLIVIEQVIGNWVDPRMQGSQVALSPLVILVAVVFWGWLWGVAGAFLGTPMTLAIMVLCNAIVPLRPVALLLSNQGRAEDLDAVLSRAAH